MGALSDGRDDAIYHGLIVWSDVAPGDEPLNAAGCQLKACLVRPVQLVRFDLKMGGIAVEDGDALSMSDRCVIHKDVLPH